MKEKKETREMVAGYMGGSRKGIGKGGLMQSNSPFILFSSINPVYLTKGNLFRD